MFWGLNPVDGGWPRPAGGTSFIFNIIMEIEKGPTLNSDFYKKDILDQINELYVKKRKVSQQIPEPSNRPQIIKNTEYLVPTKATLFGLDVRFRTTDKKLEDDKRKCISSVGLTLAAGRRSAFKVSTNKKRKGDDDEESEEEPAVPNRHALPTAEVLAKMNTTVSSYAGGNIFNQTASTNFYSENPKSA